ncbi:hypothetical protein NDU88_003107 [Pleurodeles waltl]|uniref:Uncharacterized protein n=1 Tax=Pleurodeles waltl TaxID=8319 RepID=A0AAV7VH04_PLEWA|nr:hypothetical protein NDU88_003107 [Pleurodeles waltl]
MGRHQSPGDKEHVPGIHTRNQQGVDIIMNLSKIILTEDHEKVLYKGSGYVPTNKMDSFKMRQELSEFFRHICLKIFLDGSVETSQRPGDTGFRPKSTFTPNLAQLPQEVTVFEQAVTNEIENLGREEKHSFMNLSRLEQKALEELNLNPSIIIKPADKGGAIVILDREVYHQECIRLLSDNRNYKFFKSDPTQDTQKEIKMLVEEAINNGWVTEKEGNFL